MISGTGSSPLGAQAYFKSSSMRCGTRVSGITQWRPANMLLSRDVIELPSGNAVI